MIESDQFTPTSSSTSEDQSPTIPSISTPQDDDIVIGEETVETDKTETDTADTVDQLSNISSDIGSDSELSDGEDYDNESDVSEPPIILDSDDEAPALPVKYASTMTPAQLQQQTTLHTREALTRLGHQQARQMIESERLEKYINTLYSSIISHPCYLTLENTIKREDLDLTLDIEDSRHREVFDAFKIAKTNLGHKRYLLQQAMYQDLLRYKITTLTQSLESSKQNVKEVEQSESEWVSQLDQADKNLTKVSKYWESRYKILEDSLTLHQKNTRLLKISWVATILFLQYINWWGVSSLTGMVWALCTTFYDTILYIVKTGYQNPLIVFGIMLIGSGYVMYTLYNQNKSLRESTSPTKPTKTTKSKKE